MTDEPMYLISESELKKVTHFNWMEVWDRVRARGPVQQAPAGPCKDCTDPNQCYVPCHQVPKNPCIERGCTDIEDCDEICVHSRIFSPNWVKEHDAALIAQEREKWERELRVDAQNPWCYPGCILVDKAKAQAREDVLDELERFVDGLDPDYIIRERIELLRQGKKQERSP